MSWPVAKIAEILLGWGAVAVVTWGELRHRRPRRDRAHGERISIGGVPVPEQLEPLHFLVSGSTGTGKSQAILGILNTIRERGDRCIVADPGGQYLSRWWRPHDTILNPLDQRSVAWSPFAEMDGPADADRIARSMVPSLEGQGDSAQWQLYSQGLVSAILQRLWETGAATNSALVHSLTIAKSDEIEALVAGLPAQTLFDTGASRMLSSVRGIVGSYLPPYRFLAPAAGLDAWSIRNWVESGRGWLWLPYRDSERAALAPLIAAWLGEATSAALSLPPSRTRRLWMILDEVAALGRIQALDDALVRGRKYGLRAVLGVQSIAQLRQSYTRDGAQVLLSCLSSALILRASDAETADQMSRLLGERQLRRSQKSYGPSGTSSSEHITIERVVLASEVQNLPDLHGYLSLAGDHPIARVSIPIVHKDPVVESFVPVTGGTDGAVATGSSPPEAPAETPPRLKVELVPRGCSGESLRAILTADAWQSARKRVALSSGGVCAVCGGAGEKWPIELHESWSYDDAEHIQRLAGLVALCPSCHESVHIGHAAQRGRERQALGHLATVNGWDLERARSHVDASMRVVQERGQHKWTQDISWLARKFPDLHFAGGGQRSGIENPKTESRHE